MANPFFEVKGDLVSGMNRAIRKIKGRTLRGVIKAAQLVRRRAVQDTPVDTGNLRASAYVDGEELPFFGPVAEIGYTAEYAPYVHEILTSKHPVGEAKFLQNALIDSQKDVLRIIKEETKV